MVCWFQSALSSKLVWTTPLTLTASMLPTPGFAEIVVATFHQNVIAPGPVTVVCRTEVWGF
jgi:hypothetical protein